MRSLGQNPTAREIREMIFSVDDNGNGTIDFEEFLQLMKSRGLGYHDPEKELRDAFKVFDKDGSGSISRDELKLLMLNLGQNLTEGEIDAMMVSQYFLFYAVSYTFDCRLLPMRTEMEKLVTKNLR